MSTGSTILNPCPNIQEELNNHFLTCSAASLREPEPLLDFILSPTNSGSVGSVVSPGNGKIRTVELRYDQRILESEVDTDVANPTCEATTNRGDHVQTYEMDITENLFVEELIDLKTWAEICRDNPSVFAGKVQRLMDALYRKTATVVATQAAAIKGKWASDVSPVAADYLQVKTLLNTNDLAPYAMEDIDLALMQSGYCAPAFIAGGTDLYKYFRRALAGCCATQGVSIDEVMRLYGKAVAYDRKLAAALGGNDKSLAIQPGALSLAVYTANAAYNGLDVIAMGSDVNPIVVTDPASGLQFDFNVANKCGKIHLTMYSTVKLFGLPSDLFATGDTKNGVNFVAGIDVQN